MLIGDPDALFKGFCILQLRFICVFIRASENQLGKNRQNEYKQSTSKFVKSA